MTTVQFWTKISLDSSSDTENTDDNNDNDKNQIFALRKEEFELSPEEESLCENLKAALIRLQLQFPEIIWVRSKTRRRVSESDKYVCRLITTGYEVIGKGKTTKLAVFDALESLYYFLPEDENENEDAKSSDSSILSKNNDTCILQTNSPKAQSQNEFEYYTDINAVHMENEGFGYGDDADESLGSSVISDIPLDIELQEENDAYILQTDPTEAKFSNEAEFNTDIDMHTVHVEDDVNQGIDEGDGILETSIDSDTNSELERPIRNLLDTFITPTEVAIVMNAAVQVQGESESTEVRIFEVISEVPVGVGTNSGDGLCVGNFGVEFVSQMSTNELRTKFIKTNLHPICEETENLCNDDEVQEIMSSNPVGIGCLAERETSETPRLDAALKGENDTFTVQTDAIDMKMNAVSVYDEDILKGEGILETSAISETTLDFEYEEGNGNFSVQTDVMHSQFENVNNTSMNIAHVGEESIPVHKDTDDELYVADAVEILPQMSKELRTKVIQPNLHSVSQETENFCRGNGVQEIVAPETTVDEGILETSAISDTPLHVENEERNGFTVQTDADATDSQFENKYVNNNNTHISHVGEEGIPEHKDELQVVADAVEIVPQMSKELRTKVIQTNLHSVSQETENPCNGDAVYEIVAPEISVDEGLLETSAISDTPLNFENEEGNGTFSMQKTVAADSQFKNKFEYNTNVNNDNEHVGEESIHAHKVELHVVADTVKFLPQMYVELQTKVVQTTLHSVSQETENPSSSSRGDGVQEIVAPKISVEVILETSAISDIPFDFENEGNGIGIVDEGILETSVISDTPLDFENEEGNGNFSVQTDVMHSQFDKKFVNNTNMDIAHVEEQSISLHKDELHVVADAAEIVPQMSKELETNVIQSNLHSVSQEPENPCKGDGVQEIVASDTSLGVGCAAGNEAGDEKTVKPKSMSDALPQIPSTSVISNSGAVERQPQNNQRGRRNQSANWNKSKKVKDDSSWMNKGEYRK